MHWVIPPKNREVGFVDALGMMGVVGLLVARYIPVARLPFWGCWLRKATGWPCPGCGLTRAAERISLGQWWSAFDVNPLGALAFILLGALALMSFLHLAFAMPIPELRMNEKEARWTRIVLGILVLLNYSYVVIRTRFPGVL